MTVEDLLHHNHLEVTSDSWNQNLGVQGAGPDLTCPPGVALAH